ncbi:MAG: glycosyltransferase [Cyclobacteriaceae bacterium]
MPLLFSRASNNVCVSTALAEEVTVNYRVNPNKVSIIQNYYDLDSLVKKSEEHIPEKYQFLKDKNYLVAVGRLHSQKGYSALIELYSVIKEDINTSLVIVGSGDLLEDLIKECIDLNLRPCVIEDTPPDADFDVYFLGYVKNSLPIVSHAKMFLLTSFWEGFPNVLIEAMAAKTLVLASDCPTGPSEILISHDLSGNSVESNTYGILLPTLENKADFVLWRDAILKYHSDSTEKQEIIKKAFSSLDRFSRINSIDKWRDIINGK